MNNIFDSVFDTVGTDTPQGFVICVAAALVAGISISVLYSYRNRHSDSFAVTIALLPTIVSVVIMVVSGDIGAGIAVAGAFSLVRFRSAPGTAKEIAIIFLAMATGLLVGRGFVAYALAFAAVVGLSFFLLTYFNFGAPRSNAQKRLLKITIPEDLDYGSGIEDMIAAYTDSYELIKVRTANMGSVYKLTYRITMRDTDKIRDMIDDIRVRNGNLEVAVLHEETEKGGL